MATVTQQLLTAEEFHEWASRPENQSRSFELERGEVVEMPPPSELHGVVCFLIARLLGNYIFARRRGYMCTNDTGLLVEHEPDSVRGPDLMLFDESRRLDEMRRKFTDRVPRLVVEVLSPNDQTTKVNRRISQYLKRGVARVWLVDPEVRSITVYHPEKTHWVLDETDELADEELLAGFRCKVADLFALPEE